MPDDEELVPPPSTDLVARARAFRGSGAPIAAAKPSATVVLLRDALSGLEVFMLRRLTTMAFGAGAHVFPGGVVDDADQAAGDAARVLAHAAVRETLEETGVLVQAESLRPWSRWITPNFEPRRYDTIFFVVLAPADQVARHVEDEADAGDWISPRDALASQHRRERFLMPPTEATLRELTHYESASDVLAVAVDRDLEPLLFTIDLDVEPPRWVRT
jgi:8-oxo-dGTP pyrophosphatase MutT (NUDIX family)